MSPISTTFAFLMPGHWEWIALALLGLLLFGKRLPEVGKSLGKSIVEFKKGLRGVEEDVNRAVEADQADMLPPPQNDKPSESTTAQAQPEETGTPSNSSTSSD